MRKKSHISLATYLMNCTGMEHIQEHKKSFYLGSILPDCTPSFLTRRHSIDKTFHILREEIRNITDDYDMDMGMSRYYFRHLGVITHYIADYFTFPHNTIFNGTMKEHCDYEKDLKFELKEYVQSEDAKRVRLKNGTFTCADDICHFIIEMHEEYLNVINEIKSDCYYIVTLCHRVVDAILQIFELNNVEIEQFDTVYE